MSTPETPAPEPVTPLLPYVKPDGTLTATPGEAPAPKAKFSPRKLLVWAVSAEGRKDIGAAIAAVTAIYTALHRSGL